MQFVRHLFLLLLATCAVTLHAAERVEITVSAAISLKNAFEEIGVLYEQRGGARVLFNFGASGELLQQIVGGAPVDVFASAAQLDMEAAQQQGLLLAGTRSEFAGNQLVLVVPTTSTSRLGSFKGLSHKSVKRIAMGNPRTVPAGRYAQEVFAFFKLLPALSKKLIFAENVRQVLDYVARDEVDAGVVYATDAASRPHDVRVVSQAPESSHAPVVYPIAVVGDSAHEQEARAFLALVLSDDGQQILRTYGFLPAPR